VDIQITHDFKRGDPFKESQKLLDKIGTYIVGEIRKRTTKDYIDADELPFKQYSPGYKKYYTNRNVNLTKSGDMMQSLHLRTKGANEMEVGVDPGQSAKAAWNEDNGRIFLGVNDKDEKVIDAIVDEYIDQELAKL
jgi:hypothetical protein